MTDVPIEMESFEKKQPLWRWQVLNKHKRLYFQNE